MSTAHSSFEVAVVAVEAAILSSSSLLLFQLQWILKEHIQSMYIHTLVFVILVWAVEYSSCHSGGPVVLALHFPENSITFTRHCLWVHTESLIGGG